MASATLRNIRPSLTCSPTCRGCYDFCPFRGESRVALGSAARVESMKHLAVRCWAIVLLFTGAGLWPQLGGGPITCGPNESCPPGLQCVGGVCRSGPQNDAGANATLTV